MKKIIILYFFTTIFVLYAQEWKKLELSLEPQDNYTLLSASFINGSVGYISAFSPASIWKTTDGGNNWTIVLRVASDWLHSISFPDGEHGWAILEKSATGEKYLYHTEDGGATWEYDVLFDGFYSLRLNNEFEGYAYLPGFYKTDDGGNTWTEKNIIYPENILWPVSLTDVFFVDDTHGWAIGVRSDVTDSGSILKTIDGGENWYFTEELVGPLNTIYFTSANIGFLAYTRITNTQDGGETWNWNNGINVGAIINDMVFINQDIGWAVGNSGKIVYTTNGGITWQTYDAGITDDLLGIQFVEDGNIGYIWGMNNTLLKYETAVGVDEHGEVIPNEFSLEQNYPNPFNPSTVISYQLVVDSKAVLTVYDVLGKEITTLVNELQSAGAYSVTFDAPDLPSGVYIYSVHSNGKTISRKMLLMK